MLATALATSSRSVALIDPASRLPRGAAYSTRWSEHLLNVPAIKMGAVDGDPEGFYAWLHSAEGKENAQRYGIDSAIKEDGFVPRALYGDYLTHISAAGLAHASLIAKSAKYISKHRNGYQIGFTQGHAIEAKQLVLATGNGFAHDVTSHPSYFGKPWACNFDAIAMREASDPIIIIGSGLTAVDTLISLLKRKVSCPIIVLSRHGIFPAAHAEHPLQTPPYFAPALLADTKLSLRMRALRKFITTSTQAGHSWQSCMDAVRPHTTQLWQSLSVDVQLRFMRHGFSHWNRARHRMASSLLPVLEEGLNKKRFIVHSASVRSVLPHQVILSDGEAIAASTIFDCRGPRYSVATSPLLAGLFEEGIITPHHTGFGLHAYDAAGRVSINNAPTIYAIGPLLVGAQLEATAVPELRVQIANVAHALQKATTHASKHS